MGDTPLVLGIDPGTHRLGYGLVTRRGNRFVHTAHGVARAHADAPLAERLVAIGDELAGVIEAYKPAMLAMEEAFVHKDPRAALMIGHARGVVMYIAARAQLTVYEYPPATVKRAVVGSGRADKDQVNAMIRAILGLVEAPPLDASDALAVAICHAGASVHQRAAEAVAAATAAAPAPAARRSRPRPPRIRA